MMSEYYIFDRIDRTMKITDSLEEVTAAGSNPLKKGCVSPAYALFWLNRHGDKFEPQALAEYRSYLEEAAEVAGGVRRRASEPSACAPKAEQAAPDASMAASEALEGALCLAAQSIARALSDELAGAIETREDIARTCERIEAYRLALSALSRTLIKAERAAQEG